MMIINLLQDIAVHNPDDCPYKSLQEYLPEKAPVFMMGWPHYGCQGEVSFGRWGTWEAVDVIVSQTLRS